MPVRTGSGRAPNNSSHPVRVMVKCERCRKDRKRCEYPVNDPDRECERCSRKRLHCGDKTRRPRPCKTQSAADLVAATHSSAHTNNPSIFQSQRNMMGSMQTVDGQRARPMVPWYLGRDMHCTTPSQTTYSSGNAFVAMQTVNTYFLSLEICLEIRKFCQHRVDAINEMVRCLGKVTNDQIRAEIQSMNISIGKDFEKYAEFIHKDLPCMAPGDKEAVSRRLSALEDQFRRVSGQDSEHVDHIAETATSHHARRLRSRVLQGSPAERERRRDLVQPVQLWRRVENPAFTSLQNDGEGTIDLETVQALVQLSNDMKSAFRRTMGLWPAGYGHILSTVQPIGFPPSVIGLIDNNHALAEKSVSFGLCNPYEADFFGRNACYIAVETLNLPFLEFLTHSHPEIVKKSPRDIFNVSLLALAAYKGNLQIFNHLLLHGADPKERVPMGYKARTIIAIASYAGSLEIVKHLLENGLTNAEDECGLCSPLHDAAKRGQLEVVQTLIRYVDPRKRYNGQLASDIARSHKHMNIADFLVYIAGLYELEEMNSSLLQSSSYHQDSWDEVLDDFDYTPFSDGPLSNPVDPGGTFSVI